MRWVSERAKGKIKMACEKLVPKRLIKFENKFSTTIKKWKFIIREEYDIRLERKIHNVSAYMNKNIFVKKKSWIKVKCFYFVFCFVLFFHRCRVSIGDNLTSVCVCLPLFLCMEVECGWPVSYIDTSVGVRVVRLVAFCCVFHYLLWLSGVAGLGWCKMESARQTFVKNISIFIKRIIDTN